MVKAAGKDIVIVYENKSGSPYIKEVRAEGVPAAFLAQFAGKGHDDKFAFGADVKANGADEATAKAIRKAMRHEPSIDWLLANQDKVPHYFHQLAVEGKL